MKCLKIGIAVLFLLALAITVFAETKPARGYLQTESGSPLAGKPVYVVVKVHSTTEHPCYCNTYEVLSSQTGEFVSDFGNLYYLGDCDFWNKKDKDSCYNDWKGGDLVLVNANNELKEARGIDRAPIFEIGYLKYKQEVKETIVSPPYSGGSTASIDNLKNEVKTVYVTAESSQELAEPTLSIKDMRVGIIDGDYYILTEIVNPTEESFNGLGLEVVTKDIDGQVHGTLQSDEFSLANQSSKTVKLKWELDSNAGIYMVSSLVNGGGKVIAASKEIQVIVDRTILESTLISESPGIVKYSSYLAVLLLLILIVLLLVLALEVRILRKQNTRRKKDKENKKIDTLKKSALIIFALLIITLVASNKEFNLTGFVSVDHATAVQGWIYNGTTPVNNASVYVYANASNCTCRSQEAVYTSNTGEFVDFIYNFKVAVPSGDCTVGFDCPSIDSDRDTMWIVVNGSTAIPPVNNANTNPTNITLLPHNPSWSIIWLNTTVTADFAPPVISLVSPTNNSNWSYSNTVNFTYNVTDDSNITNCSLIINGTLNQTDTTVQRNVSQAFSLSLPNGIYSWSVNCTDIVGNTGSSASWILNVSIANLPPTQPTVDLTPDIPYDSDNLLCNITVNSTDPNNDTVYYIFQFYNNSQLFSTTAPTMVTSVALHNSNTHAGDVWNCTVTPYDGTVNGTAGSDNVTILANIPMPPIVNLESPLNNSNWTLGNPVVFQFNTTDLDGNISSCGLYLNGTLNSTLLSVMENITQNFTANLSNGDYLWKVNCTDNSSLSNVSSEWIVHVLGGGLASPAYFNITKINDTAILLNWSQVPGAESYNIYYYSSACNLKNLNVSSPDPSFTKITNITITNYTDSNFSSDALRHYIVSAVQGSLENASSRIVGKQTFMFKGLSGTGNSFHRETWLGFALNISLYAEQFLDDIGSSAIRISELVKNNATDYSVVVHDKDTVANNYSLDVGIKYVVETSGDKNYTIVGDAVLYPVTWVMYGLSGTGNSFHRDNWKSLVCINQTYTAESILDDIGNVSIRISKLVKNNATDYSVVVHDKDTVANNYTLSIGEGYTLETSGNANLTVNG